MAAIICVTVVLPLLPVTAIQRSRVCCAPGAAEREQPAPLSRQGQRGRPFRPAFGQRRRHPPTLACGRKSLASKRSRRAASAKSPARGLRVSLCTRSTAGVPSPTGASEQQRVQALWVAMLITPPRLAPLRQDRRGLLHARDLWWSSWPLPISRIVSRRGLAQGGDGRPGVLDHLTACVFAAQPGADLAPGWPRRLNGLSLVSTTRSAEALRDRAHPADRLAVSRLPPQPNTATAGRRAAWRRGRQRAISASKAHRANGRNRPPPRGRRATGDALHAPGTESAPVLRPRPPRQRQPSANPDHGQQVGTYSPISALRHRRARRAPDHLEPSPPSA